MLTIKGICAKMIQKGLIHMKKNTLFNMVLCGLFAAVTAVCSWITVPVAVPFTMQTFAIFCTLAILGGKWGTLSVLVYLLAGFAGVPVFAGFWGGLPALFTASGGFLIGFIFMALTYWAITAAFGRKLLVTVIAMTAGLLVCYAFGTAWYVLVYSKAEPVGFLTALGWCVFPFVVPDGAKMALALTVAARVRRFAKFAKLENA